MYKCEQCNYLKKRRDFYKAKFEDKLINDKEYQKLKSRFEKFLISWAKQKAEYEKRLSYIPENKQKESERK